MRLTGAVNNSIISMNRDVMICECMDALIRWGKAFSDPARIRIIAALQGGELCVCELSDALELGQSTLSSHLQLLRQAGLVTVRKDGKWSYYALLPTHVPLIVALFHHYTASLESHPRRQRDVIRLRRRLDLRVDGRCVLGFAELDEPEMAFAEQASARHPATDEEQGV